jgi:hypothetical protein
VTVIGRTREQPKKVQLLISKLYVPVLTSAVKNPVPFMGISIRGRRVPSRMISLDV